MKLNNIHEALDTKTLGLGDTKTYVIPSKDYDDKRYVYAKRDDKTQNMYAVFFSPAEITHSTPYISEIVKVNPTRVYSIELVTAPIDDTARDIMDYPWSYSKTGAGNAPSVYRFLMSSVQDFFLNKMKPAIVKFHGYTPDMNLIYDIVMKKFSEKYKDTTYLPYYKDLFINMQTVEKIKNQEVKNDILNITGIAGEQYKKMISRSMADKDEERTERRDRNSPGKYRSIDSSNDTKPDDSIMPKIQALDPKKQNNSSTAPQRKRITAF